MGGHDEVAAVAAIGAAHVRVQAGVGAEKGEVGGDERAAGAIAGAGAKGAYMVASLGHCPRRRNVPRTAQSCVSSSDDSLP